MRAPIVVLSIFAFATAACANLSGYDASRYNDAQDAASVAAADPETMALPATKRLYMLDPRRPIADAAAE